MMEHRQVEQAALFYEFSLERHIPPTTCHGILNAVSPDDAKFRPIVVANSMLAQELAVQVPPTEQPNRHVDLEPFWAELHAEIRKLERGDLGWPDDVSPRRGRGDRMGLERAYRTRKAVFMVGLVSDP
ncbi:hypothetical protein ACM43_12190 [Bradyrhizobium sp. CCBAU 45321]|nr:hypothetical protein [Bradyrhizobium sp. CCBAU 45321]